MAAVNKKIDLELQVEFSRTQFGHFCIRISVYETLGHDLLYSC